MRRPVALVLTAIYLLLATFLLTNGDFDLLSAERLSAVYNDIAARLLRFDFTTDRAAISFEVFVRDGRSLAKFGIFPALLRLPLVLADGERVQVARLVCLAALGIAVYADLRLFQAVLARGTRGGGCGSRRRCCCLWCSAGRRSTCWLRARHIKR